MDIKKWRKINLNKWSKRHLRERKTQEGNKSSYLHINTLISILSLRKKSDKCEEHDKMRLI